MTETEEGMHGPEELAAMEDEEGTEEEMSFSDPEDFEDDITEEGEAGVGGAWRARGGHTWLLGDYKEHWTGGRKSTPSPWAFIVWGALHHGLV